MSTVTEQLFHIASGYTLYTAIFLPAELLALHPCPTLMFTSYIHNESLAPNQLISCCASVRFPTSLAARLLHSVHCLH